MLIGVIPGLNPSPVSEKPRTARWIVVVDGAFDVRSFMDSSQWEREPEGCLIEVDLAGWKTFRGLLGPTTRKRTMSMSVDIVDCQPGYEVNSEVVTAALHAVLDEAAAELPLWNAVLHQGDSQS
ncbi:MAG: hypothetical protein AAFX05_05385 [Planctomycetota bacterium]